MPIFASLDLLPEDPILSITGHFNADPRPQKVNLGVGTYKDEDGNPYPFSSVRKAEALILKENLNKEYLPIDGDTDYCNESLKLVFGEDLVASDKGTLYGIQGVGGAGALRIGADLLKKSGVSTIWISDPTWPNHKGIFERAGLRTVFYPYYNFEKHQILFSELCEIIKNIPTGDAICLHGCCHNPTGTDFSMEQWKILSDLIKKRGIIPFFDLAYQGFKKGIEEDAAPIRLFYEQGHEMLVASSYSKNFGLYGERAGFLAIVIHEKESMQKVISQVRSLIRTTYSNPPIHPARIVKTLLKSPSLKQEWLEELATIRARIKEMRHALFVGLSANGNERRFAFLNEQSGIFSFIGLDARQVEILRQENGIYMPANGRINVAGLNTHNINYVVEALLACNIRK